MASGDAGRGLLSTEADGVEGMKHKHVGPPDRACDGCYVEAQQLIEAEDDEVRRAWRKILVVYFVGLILLTCILVWKLHR